MWENRTKFEEILRYFKWSLIKIWEQFSSALKRIIFRVQYEYVPLLRRYFYDVVLPCWKRCVEFLTIRPPNYEYENTVPHSFLTYGCLLVSVFIVGYFIFKFPENHLQILFISGIFFVLMFGFAWLHRKYFVSLNSYLIIYGIAIVYGFSLTYILGYLGNYIIKISFLESPVTISQVIVPSLVPEYTATPVFTITPAPTITPQVIPTAIITPVSIRSLSYWNNYSVINILVLLGFLVALFIALFLSLYWYWRKSKGKKTKDDQDIVGKKETQHGVRTISPSLREKLPDLQRSTSRSNVIGARVEQIPIRNVELFPQVDKVIEVNKKDKSEISLKVFLCHSSNDKPKVKQLYDQLRLEKGIDPWLDTEKLLPGVDWDLEIRSAVKSSNVVLVFLSRNSINKEGYIQKEIKQALDVADEKPDGTIFIVPLRLEDCDVPTRLKRWQWLNLYEKESYNKLLLSLRKRADDLETKSVGVQ